MKQTVLLVTAILSISLFCLWGCSPKEAPPPSGNNSVIADSEEGTGTGAAAESPVSTSPQVQSSEVPETDSSLSNLTESEVGEKNSRASSLEEADYKEFAKQIQEVFADEDMEALAQLCAYPVYVTTEANTEGLDMPDAAGLKSQKDDIFTEVMLQAVDSVDPDKLIPSQAGIFMGSESGSPGLVFSLTEDGQLKIMGINSEVVD